MIIHTCLDCRVEFEARLAKSIRCPKCQVKYHRTYMQKYWASGYKRRNPQQYGGRRVPISEGQCRYCQHPIPAGWKYPICERCRDRRFGLDGMYGVTM